MEQAQDICARVEKAASQQELEYPHPVWRFLAITDHGPAETQSYALVLGNILFEAGGERNRLITEVFAGVSSTMPKTELIAKLAEACAQCGYSAMALAAAEIVQNAHGWVRQEVQATLNRHAQRKAAPVGWQTSPLHNSIPLPPLTSPMPAPVIGPAAQPQPQRGKVFHPQPQGKRP